MTPTQDVCLGLYFLTVPSQQDKLAGKLAGKVPAGEEQRARSGTTPASASGTPTTARRAVPTATPRSA